MKKIAKILFLIIFVFSATIINCNAEELNCNYILRKGNSGNRVKVLQRVLNEKMDCNLNVDGSFGKLTKACVIKYQKAENIEQDGIVGPITCNRLNGIILEEKKAYKEYESTDKITAVVLNSKINLRKLPTTKSKILTTLKRGELVQIISQKSNWYYVLYDNTYGYIRSDLIAKDCIVVDISDQTFYYYESGNLKWSTAVVTGNSGNHDTPVGNYILDKNNYKTATYLKGYNDNGTRYKSYVDYWMPFILGRGIGFHDAMWRDSWEYTQTRFKGHGSHGCVNMQHEAAEKLYNETLEKINVVVRD